MISTLKRQNGNCNKSLRLESSNDENRASDDGWKEEADLLMIQVPQLNESFVIKDKIGEGTFSSVYLAKVRHGPTHSNSVTRSKYVAMKHVIPTSHPNRVLMELDCMLKFGGRCNVMGVYTCVREGSHFVMVMPYFRHNRFTDFIGRMDLEEIRNYFYNLLIALESIHCGGIIHRDVKPSNFLYCRKRRRYALVDFGLAQYVTNPGVVASKHPAAVDTSPVLTKRLKGVNTVERIIGGDAKRNSVPADVDSSETVNENSRYLGGTKSFLKLVPGNKGSSSRISSNIYLTVRSKDSGNLKSFGDTQNCNCFGRQQVCISCLRKPSQSAARAGTPGYRSLEVLLKHPYQTTAVDMWSVGIMLLSVLTERSPFFKASDDLSALAEIISIFGTASVKQFASKIGKTLICNPDKPALDLQLVCEKLRGSDEIPIEIERVVAYDLLKNLLDLDPDTRISASDALSHSFFATLVDPNMK